MAMDQRAGIDEVAYHRIFEAIGVQKLSSKAAFKETAQTLAETEADLMEQTV